MRDQSAVITMMWVVLNLLPLIAAGMLWLLLENWIWGLLVVILYPLYIIPYGFFIAMPLMVRCFRKPASLHRR